MTKPVIVWFRRDLRLNDNPALNEARAVGGAVIPVYVHDEAGEAAWSSGGASRWWLHHALSRLSEALRARASRLIIRKGDSSAALIDLIKETGAGAVYWNRRYESAIVARDAMIEAALNERRIATRSFNGALLFEPHTIKNKQGGPFQVFTPYWRHCLAQAVAEPVSLAKGAFKQTRKWPVSESVDALELRPRLNWADGFARHWEPGEEGAQRRLKDFLKASVGSYAQQRNLPDMDGTSRLSPWLHFGEISPRQIWSALRACSRESGVFPANASARIFLSEIGWREFAYHLLAHFPHTPTRPLRVNFENFPWAEDSDGEKLRAWQRGQTGYPIVDAGMRQLWQTGWMHNRVRMIAASFLVKHLRLPWQRGAEWFWDTLVDADLANNTLGWQWSAGCGADAAPYFRIFAPVAQGERFDREGGYVRRWIPELAKVPNKWVHQPWKAPESVLNDAGVKLGEHYPKPIVDHAEARIAALAAFKAMRTAGSGS
ncbi:MAG: deoxyribodipyrimidine photo-lyase [Opitutaceae bacterium]|nr:deoxyribodipyrimidine photo-lyase [Opitutaceae bacterium]